MSSSNEQYKVELLLNDSDEEEDNPFEDLAVIAAEKQLTRLNWSNYSDVNDDKQRLRRTNNHRDFEAPYRCFQRFYFSRFPVYKEKSFERRFRRPRSILERINNELCDKSVFAYRSNAAGKLGVHPEIWILAAHWILAYGMSFNSIKNVANFMQPLKRERDSFIEFVKEISESF